MRTGPAEAPIVLSFGGGTQTVAIVCLVAMGRLPRPDMVVMADTGREASETWDYAEELRRAAAEEARAAPRSGAAQPVEAGSVRPERRAAPAGVDARGRLPTFCSKEWKRRVVRRYLRAAGVGDCVTWIGISLDEFGRAKDSERKWQEFEWPLLFDVPLRRSECRQLVIDYGLPPPPRSSCWCCPHRQDPEWRRLREHYPEDWLGACEVDEAIRAQDRGPAGRVWLHKSRRPLAEAALEAGREDCRCSAPSTGATRGSAGCKSSTPTPGFVEGHVVLRIGGVIVLGRAEYTDYLFSV